MPERPQDQLDSGLGPQSQWACWAPLPRAPVTLRMQLDGSELGDGGEEGAGTGQEQHRYSLREEPGQAHRHILGTFPGKQ